MIDPFHLIDKVVKAVHYYVVVGGAVVKAHLHHLLYELDLR